MNILTADEARSWCAQNLVQVGAHNSLSYAPGVSRQFDIVLPDMPSRLIALAYALAAYPEVEKFRGCLLWITQWGIWSDDSERVAMRVFSGLRSSVTNTSLLQAPAQTFAPTEFADAHAFLVHPLLFQWDAWMVPDSAEYLLHVSHDGVVRIKTKSADVFSAMLRYCEPWSPRVKE